MVEINLNEYLKTKQKKSDTVIIFSKKEPIINNFGLIQKMASILYTHL